MKIKIATLFYFCFIIFILLISFVPLKFSEISLYSKELTYTDILLLFMFLIAFPLIFKKATRTLAAGQTIKLFYFIVIYAFFSTIWVTYDVSYWYVFYQLGVTTATIMIPALMSKITNSIHINYNKLITNFSVLLSIVFLYYIVILEPGIRLYGLLGGAAVIHTIMIPPLAVYFYNLMERKRIVVSTIGIFVTLLALFLTQSRAGLLSLILLVMLITFRKFNLKRFVVVFLFFIVFSFIILQFVDTEHYTQGFGDSIRGMNTATALAIGTQSVSSLVFGSGYGAIWQWHAYLQGVLPVFASTFDGVPIILTEYGYILYHAHSVFIQLFVELGLIGIIPFLIIMGILLKEFWASNKEDNKLRNYILGALICTLPSMHTDLFFFRNWEVSIIWLFYLFTALSYPLSTDLIKKNKSESTAS